MLIAKRSTHFRKDYRLMERRHRDMAAIHEIMARIVEEKPLPVRCEEHMLSGDWEGYTECHVKGDLLMTYLLSEESVTFHRLGTHSDLF